MNTFSCASVAAIISSLQGLACRCLQEETSTGKGVPADEALLDNVRHTLEQLIWLETKAKFQSKGLAVSSWAYIQRDPDITTIRQHLTIVGNQLVSDLSKHSFLWVAPDRKVYVDNDDLFADIVVSKAFPSARRDITEAGNCLAAECNTAAVFHLMRAAEFALRALARDREVAFADKPLDQKEWAQILTNLEAKLRDIREVAKKDGGWPDTVVRESQIMFYSAVIQELRGFNDAWRRHVSHADVDAFYNRDSALGVLTHVRVFFHKLATKISETSTTPKYWTKA